MHFIAFTAPKGYNTLQNMMQTNASMLAHIGAYIIGLTFLVGAVLHMVGYDLRSRDAAKKMMLWSVLTGVFLVLVPWIVTSIYAAIPTLGG